MHLLATALLAAPGFQGPFTIDNAGFEAAGALWGREPDSTVAFAPAPGPRGHQNVVARFPAGREQVIWRTLQVGDADTGAQLVRPPSPEHLGTKAEFGVWFRPVGSGFRAGDEIVLRVKSGAELVSVTSVDPSAFPRNTWHFLQTRFEPAQGLDGCVRYGTTGLTVSLTVDAGGEVWFDDLVGKPFAHDRWPLREASFEDPALGRWLVWGQAEVDTAVPAYHGRRTLLLDGSLSAVTQAVSAQGYGLGPQSGAVPEAGAWVWVQAGPAVAGDHATLQVWHEERYPAHAGLAPVRTLLAEESLSLAGAPRGRWLWLETDPSTARPVPPRTRDDAFANLVVLLAKQGSRRVRFDYVQVGEQHAVDGNPAKLAFTNYLGRFRNPAFAPDPGIDDPANDLDHRWRSWFWNAPPACDPGYFPYVHDPTAARGGADPRDAGRRDLAVSAWDGKHLPLVGAYDSRDPVVVDFHLRLIEAAGFDAVMFGWYGQKAVELDECSPIRDSVNGPTLQAVYDAIEAARSDLKVATKLNLQRHLNDAFAGAAPGCDFPSEDTLVKKRDGIRDDLVWLVETYHDHRATLKRDGRMVVSIFDPGRDFAVASGAVVRFTEADWALVKAQVEAATGRGLELLLDTAPRLTTPLAEAGDWYDGVADGVATWMLVPCSLMLFDDFEDFLDGERNTVSELDVRAHFRRNVNGRPYRWWRADDARRLGIAIAYPGFDDTGVAGWGKPNGACPDEGARCTRIVPASGLEDHDCPTGSTTCFLDVALDEARRSGLPWLQVPTWNDWNELTVLEPRFSQDYVEHVLGLATGPGDHDRDWVLGRLLAVQRGLAAFKGEAHDPAELDRIVEDFLRVHAGTPYD